MVFETDKGVALLVFRSTLEKIYVPFSKLKLSLILMSVFSSFRSVALDHTRHTFGQIGAAYFRQIYDILVFVVDQARVLLLGFAVTDEKLGHTLHGYRLVRSQTMAVERCWRKVDGYTKSVLWYLFDLLLFDPFHREDEVDHHYFVAQVLNEVDLHEGWSARLFGRLWSSAWRHGPW